MNSSRRFASVTTLNGFIYIAGGYTNWCKWRTSSFELYDPKTDQWTELARMNESRVCFALNESNGFLYAMGDDKLVERFEPYKNNWMEVNEMNIE